MATGVLAAWPLSTPDDGPWPFLAGVVFCVALAWTVWRGAATPRCSGCHRAGVTRSECLDCAQALVDLARWQRERDRRG